MQEYRRPTPNGFESVTEFFRGENKEEILKKMNERAEQIRSIELAKGFEVFRRKEVGRNAKCPCGSGLKFKKCCIEKAI